MVQEVQEKPKEQEEPKEPPKEESYSKKDWLAREASFNRTIAEKDKAITSLRKQSDENTRSLQAVQNKLGEYEASQELQNLSEEEKERYKLLKRKEQGLLERDTQLRQREEELSTRELDLVKGHYLSKEGVPLEVMEGATSLLEVENKALKWLREQPAKGKEEPEPKKKPGYDAKPATRTRPNFLEMSDKEFQAASKRMEAEARKKALKK